MPNTQPRPGFRTPKKPTRKQVERAEKVNAFKKDLQDVFRKHGLTIDAVIKSFGSYAQVALTIVPYEEPKAKEWSEAKKENLEIRKACKHEKLNPEGTTCENCGVLKENFGENGHGVTAAYEEVELAAIEKQKEEEALAQEDEEEGAAEAQVSEEEKAQ